MWRLFYGENMKSYIITEERLLELLQQEDTLQSLVGAGVDNWDGCDFAFDEQDRALQNAENLEGVSFVNSGVTSPSSGNYFINVCAVKSHFDRYVWLREGDSDEVIAEMAEEQGMTISEITDDYDIEEDSFEVSEKLQLQIIIDHDAKVSQ